MKVDLSCPIELWEYTLPAEDKPVCSFTFFNLGEKAISSIQIELTCFDPEGTVLARKTERPMALGAQARERFAIEVATEEQNVDSVELVIEKVWFESGEEWRRAQQAKLIEYTPNELPPNRKLEHLRFVAGQDAVGYPSLQRQAWVCVCGRVNALDADKCIRCGREKSEVFEKFSPEAVQQVIDARENELEERARQAREEASRMEFMRQTTVKKKKRARRARTAILCVLLALGSAAYLFVVLGLPELKYQTAMTTLQDGDYAQAREQFVALDGYRESETWIQECDLQSAKAQIEKSTASSLEAAMKTLRALGTYAGAEDALTEANYRKACLLAGEKDYEGAIALFEDLGDYQDSVERVRAARYQIAKGEMDNGDYESAAEKFAALGAYKDSAALKRECVYRPAKALMSQGKYDEAIEMFAEVSGYSDADELRLQCIYQSALNAQLAGDYEYAAQRFMMLGGYEDADEQMKRSIYLAANTARDSGSYEIARGLYETVIDFEDAADQVKECTYLPAKQTMAAEDFDAAAEMFKSIAGYKDSDDLYVQCVYSSAAALADSGEYDRAIALYETIPDYDDVARQLRQTKYKRADQLEKDGKLSKAAAAFDELGTYSDAQDRANAARYAYAQEAFDEGLYGVASERFEALGRYSDSRTRVKECAYELALLSEKSGELQKAYDALTAIEDYEPAQTKAKEVIYALGEELYNSGALMEASEKFRLAGKYEDAPTRVNACIYEHAQELMDEGKYQEAGNLFNQISFFSDSKKQRDACYDLWLAERADQAASAYAQGDYAAVLTALDGIDVDAMPRAYADTKTLYLDSNLRIARQLIDENRALEAYSYLMKCEGYKNADTLLNKNVYKILGTWETADGTQYAFYLNGTCRLAGTEAYFNMPGAYGIETGASAGELTRTHSFVNGDRNGITLCEDATQKVIRLTRLKQAEVSYTEDSGPSGDVVEPIETETDLIE